MLLYVGLETDDHPAEECLIRSREPFLIEGDTLHAVFDKRIVSQTSRMDYERRRGSTA
jgi:hypothetical protein